MRHSNTYRGWLLGCMLAAMATSCDDQGEVVDMNAFVLEHQAELQNYTLSAGTSTIFMNSSLAYDNEAEWIRSNPANFVRWKHGNSFYDNAAVDAKGNAVYGPVYAGYSCNSCHIHAGRTMPGTWNMRADGTYGSGEAGMSSMLVYITRRNGAFFQGYGRVLHDHTIYGVTPEGRLRVDWRYQQGQLPDGEPYELACPQYTITDWYTRMWDGVKGDSVDIRPEDLFCTVRIPLRHVGMGQMMAIDRHEIEQLAARSNYPEYGISGRCNYITERGKRQLGLSGNKAQHADLTVELGFSSDMGSTNSRYPEEICEGQAQMQQGSMMGISYKTLEVSTQDMENVDLYMHGLGVPARRRGSTTLDVTLAGETRKEREWIERGERMFYEARCHLCHVTTLHTQPRGATLLNGTQLPELGNQTIHPYSDFLLHDMGSEIMGVGLNDNYVSGLARGNEWRTTPLWGIGLQKKVNGHTYFLHDGRARNLQEAILWHGGEGEASKNLFTRMRKADRMALIKFVESL